ncbi:MAG: sugar transferase [Acidobacteria bacterium]|nr:sugar transferase [Acidobacteriota bacterium]
MAGWLIVTDAAALAAAFRLAYWVRFDLQITVAPEVIESPSTYFQLAVTLIPLWLLLFALSSLYDPQAKLGGIRETSRCFSACTVATMLVVVATFLVPTFVVSRLWVIAVWLLSFFLVSANRFIQRRVLYALRRRGYLLRPAIIVGTNEEARSLASFLADTQSSGVRMLGFVATRAHQSSPSMPVPILGRTAEVAALATRHGVEDVIVAITALPREELLWLCEELDALPVQLRLSSGLYELLTTRVEVRQLGPMPLLSLLKLRLDPTEALLKSAFERTAAFLGLLLLAPFLAGLAIWIRLDSPGPVFHRRRVLGVGGETFDAFKFRTMYVDGQARLAEQPDAVAQLQAHHKLKVDPRITKAGQFLRRYSLDELPQLFNVLVGQMALVGPRMITPEEAAKYGRQRMNLLSVRPGMTGLWQVSGRSDLTYEERVRIDMYYVRNYSLWLDLQILFIETLPAVVKGKGAY